MRRMAAIGVFVVAAGSFLPAVAQPGTGDPERPVDAATGASTDSPAEARNSAGRDAYDAHDYAKALVLFKEAYALDPNARYLFNAAKACAGLKDLEGAIYYETRYLRESPAAPDRATVEARIATVSAALGEKGLHEVQIECEPAGAGISVTPERATEVATAPGSMFLAPGSYTVACNAEGYERGDVSVLVTKTATAPLAAKVVLQKRVATGWLELTCNEKDATVFIGGTKVGPTPLAALMLSPGDYPVKVAKTGFKAWDKVVAVLPGAPTLVDVKLEVVKDEGPIVIPPVVVEEETSPWKTVSWITAAAAGAVAVAGGIVYYTGWSDTSAANDDWNDLAPDEKANPDNFADYSQDYRDAGDRAELGSWLLFSGLGVAAASAAAWYLLPDEAATTVPATTVIPLPGGATAILTIPLP